MSKHRRPPKGQSFIELQKKWYKKLKDEGFQDIEYTQPNGNEQLGMLSVGNGNLQRKMRYMGSDAVKNRIKFYDIIQSFLAHNPKWAKSGRDRFISERYAEGHSYRKIIKLYKAKYKNIERYPTFSVFVVFKVVNRLVKLAMEWNRSSPDGLQIEETLNLAEELEGGEA